MILSNYQYYSPSDIRFRNHNLYQKRPSYVYKMNHFATLFSIKINFLQSGSFHAMIALHSSYRKRVQHLLLRPIIISSLRLIITYPLLRTSCFSLANYRRSAEENWKKPNGIFNYLPCSAFTIIVHNNHAFKSRGICGFFAGKFAP